MSARWVVTSADPNYYNPVPVRLQIPAGEAQWFTAEEALLLADALETAALHQEHDGDMAKPMDCPYCESEQEAAHARAAKGDYS